MASSKSSNSWRNLSVESNFSLLAPAERSNCMIRSLSNSPYCALVENNLGFLFFNANRFDEAHEHLERARRIFSALKDRGSVAQVDDTRARVLLAQGRNEEAEKVARAAVRALEQGGRQSLLAEALTTHGIALARLALHDYARQAFFRAMEVRPISRAHSDDAADGRAKCYRGVRRAPNGGRVQAVYERADSWLEASQEPTTLQRLRRAAARVLAAGRRRREAGESEADAEQEAHA